MEITAIKITQSLGVFYIAKIKACDLLKKSTSLIARYDEDGKLRGNQRKLDEKKLKSIANFLASDDMCFPTSIIVAANIDKKGQIIEKEEERWRITELDAEKDIYGVEIPESTETSALIIDGQHRLNAFKYVDDSKLMETELLCSIFFDLPTPYQAYLFATINGNQKPVDKSLSLDLFGSNIENEPKEKWNPEKLAVYLTRRFNFSETSPLQKCIKLAPDTNELKIDKNKLLLSTSAMVSGILKLISKNPQKDRDFMAMKKNKFFGDDSRKALDDDGAVLRKLFLNCKDEEIYTILYNYFTNVKKLLWDNQPSDSVLKKTIGILVLFDILKLLLEKDRNNFEEEINKLTSLDYTDKLFSLSGGGRSSLYRILRCILCLGISKEELKDDEKKYLKKYGI